MVSTITAPTARPETADHAQGTTDVPQRYRSVILVPAHNEEESIAEAVHSLLRQTVPLDRIIVACDNCTDRTVEIVRGIAAVTPRVDVFETVDNRYRKSGALNAAWRRLDLDEVDFIASMDADTALASDFLERGLAAMEARPNLGGVCALPCPRPDQARTWWGRMLWRMQRAEYSRYAAVLRRRRWQVHVLSGAGALYRTDALRAAARIRGDGPWSATSLTEDYLLTLDLRANGWDACMDLTMHAFTDVPTTYRELWAQRLRWASGTMDDLRQYGWKPFTRRAILCHGIAAISILIRLLFAFAIGMTLFAHVGFHLHWIWLLPPIITAAERTMSLKDLEGRTWRDTLQAGLVLPEESFSMFREAYLVRAAFATYFGRNRTW
jgi:biofilm PGA synthesis N-glycosyltransferase PgaC